MRSNGRFVLALARQKLIDMARYGSARVSCKLHLTVWFHGVERQWKAGRIPCMCPGGTVVGATSEEESRSKWYELLWSKSLWANLRLLLRLPKKILSMIQWLVLSFKID